LTGVHTLLGRPKPDRGTYHIGGAGLSLAEALLPALGESVERYTQMVADISNRQPTAFASFNDMAARGQPLVRPEQLVFFSDSQYRRQGFPFQPFDRAAPLGWVRLESLFDRRSLWVPAQLVFLGYNIRVAQGEPWLCTAVTTGTAAHTDPRRALRNALLELIQVDAAIGHWYTRSSAPQIQLDRRVETIDRIIGRYFDAREPRPRFHWLKSPDLPGLSVACVLPRPAGSLPAAAVGLGTGLALLEAMYKALLEAVGVYQLGKLTALLQTLSPEAQAGAGGPQASFYNLDKNVAFYALGNDAAFFDSKFPDMQTAAASDLPGDVDGPASAQLRLLSDSFRKSGKELVFSDLTSTEARQLGFACFRVWSPDTLSLPLPSAPPARHARFAAFGGYAHDNPHPYP
jgi:thiazole/oxazole-forming peptide maturase SagD family component